MKAYRVTYPLITSIASREFLTKEEAEVFARERREICNRSSYLTSQSWRMVKVEELDECTWCNCQGPPTETEVCSFCRRRMSHEANCDNQP